jgi:serine/threonine protein kinase
MQSNTNILCTYSGYISPEYANYGLYSLKSDVFSFGVLVLEIVSGYRNRGFCHPDHQLNLLGHVSVIIVAFSCFLKPHFFVSNDVVKFQKSGLETV